ncbi:ribosome maturation factor RimP [candidate division KSB1 bacterium]|nr:ribosome maturation factor RimP [candidate division KSB1 bacterium]
MPIIEGRGAFLVDIQISGGPRKPFLSVFLDTPSGISLGECASFSRQFSDMLDMENLLEEYRLVVSSPGLNRPLKSKEDFARKIGKQVEIVVQEGEKTIHLEGSLHSVTQEEVFIETRGGISRIKLGVIKTAHLKIVL